MHALILLAAAYNGACIGSFLNVCIFRLPRRCLRIWRPKLSFCPNCRRTIPWYENLPIVSYLALLARCRGCKAPIPLRYFLVEVATTLFFIYTADRFLLAQQRDWGLAIVHALLFSALLVCALVDWDHMIIPDEIDIPGFLVAPFVCALVPGTIPRLCGWLPNGWLDAASSSIFGAALGALAIWTIRVVGGKIAGREAMGFGDVKFLAMIGGFSGWQGALTALLAGSVFGSFYGLANRIWTGKSAIFFGPFLALAGGLFLFAPGFTDRALGFFDQAAFVARYYWTR